MATTAKRSPPKKVANKPAKVANTRAKVANTSARVATHAPKPVAKRAPKKAATGPGPVAADTSALITQRIASLTDWRGATMARMRDLIRTADPELVEERKWIKPSNPHGVPTYSKGGLVLTLEVYKSVVKVTFARGSLVPDPKRLFNASLLGVRRAIDIAEGERVDAGAFQSLVRAAIAVNLARKADS